MSFKDWMSISGDLSQVALTILGAAVFWQIWLAKKDLRTRSERESKTLSIDLAEKFAKEAMPLVNEYYENLSSIKYEPHSLSMCDFTLEEVKTLTPQQKQAYQESIDFFRTHPVIYNECIKILNWLEWFSMSLMNGIANEEILFPALGNSYCSFVEKSFSILSFARKSKELHPYDNTVNLYNKWYNRIRVEGLSVQQDGIQKQLQEMTKKSEKISPIGTK